MRKCIAAIAGGAFVAVAPATAAVSPPGAGYPWAQPVFARIGHVTAPTAVTLPGGRYAWVHPVFVRLPNGLFKVVRITG